MAQGGMKLSHESSANERLLQAVTEQIKTPLLHIAQHAELAAGTGDNSHQLRLIEMTTRRTLQFIDSYLFSSQLVSGQQTLAVEPVSLSSILNDTAHTLHGLAREYGCELELRLAGKYGPVMAHKEGLQAALINLGMVMIEEIGTLEAARPPLILAAHGSRGGTVAGVFADIKGLNRHSLRRSQDLYGRARQPLNSALASGGAGIFVAGSILSAMSAPLRAARYQKLNGLAATFLPSRQLTLI